jgi:hypothetical protein
MPTPSGKLRNWSGVALGGTAGTGIKDISIDYGIQDIRDGADADRGPTHGIVTFEQSTITVQSTNPMLWLAIGHGVKGIFTATWQDSYNYAVSGGGAYTITTNALTYIADRKQNGPYNQLGTCNITLHTTWADGTTNPITVATV